MKTGGIGLENVFLNCVTSLYCLLPVQDLVWVSWFFWLFFTHSTSVCTSLLVQSHQALCTQPVSTATINSNCFCNGDLTGTSCTRPEPVLNKKQHNSLPRQQHLCCQHSLSPPLVQILVSFLTQLCWFK